MNVEDQNQPLGALYQEVLKARESLDTLVVPSDKIDALSVALDRSLRIIKDVALMSAFVEANLSAVFQKLDVLGEDKTIGDLINREFQELAVLRYKVLNGAFLDATHFVRQFELMVRHDILVKAGIDPKDEEAALAYLTKLGNNVILADPNPGN